LSSEPDPCLEGKPELANARPLVSFRDCTIVVLEFSARSRMSPHTWRSFQPIIVAIIVDHH
jgi:hypothetical protein